MTLTLELDDDLEQRIEDHREPGQTPEEFVEELLNIYENTRFVQEGYSE